MKLFYYLVKKYIIERVQAAMTRAEYIEEINNLLELADDELLDFVFQLLQKSVSPSLTETHQQPA